ncbi:MAG: GGDEF domain-containing protein [Alphaproteobacteria bacterium]
MEYLQSAEQAKKFSEAAMQRIASGGYPPSPEMYELWYVYYGKLDAELVRAVEILEISGAEFSHEQCQELHHRYLSNSAQNERVEKAGDQINMTIDAVGGIVQNVKNATTEYNKSLETVTEKLAGDIQIEEARAALNDVVGTTKNMLAQNAKLEEALVQSNLVMQELQNDLERVRKEAMTDSLTGLSNRKALDAAIARTCAEAAQDGGETFTFVMFDIDHFKEFNDNYGHQIGDQVLRLVGKTLFDGVKGRDVVARYGGEEFVMILPNTDLKSAVTLSNALRLAVAGKEIVNRNTNEKMGRITLSGGAAEYIKGETPEDIIERADRALYVAKNNGRNQIASATATVSGRLSSAS